jgi:hypothetical protein
LDLTDILFVFPFIFFAYPNFIENRKKTDIK